MNKTLNSLMAVVLTVGFAGAALAQSGAPAVAPTPAASAEKKVEAAKPATAATPAKAEAAKPAKVHKEHGHAGKGDKHGKAVKSELKSEVKADVKTEGKAPAAK